MLKSAAATTLLLFVVTSSSQSSAGPVPRVQFETHKINLKLDVPAHKAVIADEGTMRVNAGWNLFFIAKDAGSLNFLVDGKPVQLTTCSVSDTLKLPAELAGSWPNLDEKKQSRLAYFRADKTASVAFKIAYSDIFKDSVDNVQFSRETVGREVTGTIIGQGAYLSSSAYFYPQGEDSLANFSVVADIPSAWDAVCDGNRMTSEVKGARRIITWENPFKSDGCTFMAAPYVVKSTSADSVDVSCAFFAADTGLFQNYLTSTGKYIEMYSDLIGKYPFKNFTVAENFFPTGYGMPAWTLLGQTVLRLPFIVATSLGHEVLHNWWGNSVYVDYSRGNWCEAATTYGADYHYKEMESPAAARDYRKDILKQYVTYVSKDKDFPIRDFKSRTSTNTRVIGYNKAMMVYHMIEQEIGTQAFFDSWKSIYRQYRGQKISWEEWIKTFEKTSGKDLSWVIPQWIDRVGAPVLALGPVKIDSNATTASKTLHIAIQDQATRPYHLRIPIRVEGTNLTIDTTILMDGAEVSVSMTVPSAAQTLAIDPDYHIFRRLYPDEIEPIVSAVLGAERRAYACTATDSASVTAFTSFCSALAEDTVKITADTSLAMLQKIGAPVLLNPKTLPEYLKAHVAQTPFQIQLDGTSFDRKGHTFVLAAQGVSDTDRSLVILTDDLQSLPRLGQLVPHYGKYSYLVFEGTKNVGKGQWPVIRSVLKVAL